MTQPLPFPLGSVNRAIEAETGEGPLADALRDLARHVTSSGPGPSGGNDTLFYGADVLATDSESGDLVATRIPPGHGTGTPVVSLVIGGGRPLGIVMQRLGTLAHLVVRQEVPAATQGMDNIDYELFVYAPGSETGVATGIIATLSASAPAGSYAQSPVTPVGVGIGDLVELRATPAAGMTIPGGPQSVSGSASFQ